MSKRTSTQTYAPNCGFAIRTDTTKTVSSMSSRAVSEAASPSSFPSLLSGTRGKALTTVKQENMSKKVKVETKKPLKPLRQPIQKLCQRRDDIVRETFEGGVEERSEEPPIIHSTPRGRLAMELFMLSEAGSEVSTYQATECSNTTCSDSSNNVTRTAISVSREAANSGEVSRIQENDPSSQSEETVADVLNVVRGEGDDEDASCTVYGESLMRRSTEEGTGSMARQNRAGAEELCMRTLSIIRDAMYSSLHRDTSVCEERECGPQPEPPLTTNELKMLSRHPRNAAGYYKQRIYERRRSLERDALWMPVTTYMSCAAVGSVSSPITEEFVRLSRVVRYFLEEQNWRYAAEQMRAHEMYCALFLAPKNRAHARGTHAAAVSTAIVAVGFKNSAKQATCTANKATLTSTTFATTTTTTNFTEIAKTLEKKNSMAVSNTAKTGAVSRFTVGALQNAMSSYDKEDAKLTAKVIEELNDSDSLFSCSSQDEEMTRRQRSSSLAHNNAAHRAAKTLPQEELPPSVWMPRDELLSLVKTESVVAAAASPLPTLRSTEACVPRMPAIAFSIQHFTHYEVPEEIKRIVWWSATHSLARIRLLVGGVNLSSGSPVNTAAAAAGSSPSWTSSPSTSVARVRSFSRVSTTTALTTPPLTATSAGSPVLPQQQQDEASSPSTEDSAPPVFYDTTLLIVRTDLWLRRRVSVIGSSRRGGFVELRILPDVMEEAVLATVNDTTREQSIESDTMKKWDVDTVMSRGRSPSVQLPTPPLSLSRRASESQMRYTQSSTPSYVSDVRFSSIFFFPST